ncbi:hypothetical protein QUC31_007658 [Theobroma cacao]|uniref:Uncharacterized protein LOC18604991 n=2 Tax=Theobroma cacao TaxID=3641 RepID=A0AB32W268_THECC|nr:PREDICTED: uncharacterized protein LOC18604991 [Theobroma cacao]EOY22290.1 Uncharacterized protein TCM_014508 [Theobroma cacao]WRX17903.1 hypothetical protein QQP08_010390 [Theobroma cacao]
MASMPKFSYHRLKNEGWFDEVEEEQAILFKKTRKWSRGLRRFGIRKRPKLRIPGLRRFVRKRSRFLSKVKLSWGKALKRLKNGQAHMNDLFGGNFLVLQVNHTPFRSGEKPCRDHGLRGW